MLEEILKLSEEFKVSRFLVCDYFFDYLKRDYVREIAKRTGKTDESLIKECLLYLRNRLEAEYK